MTVTIVPIENTRGTVAIPFWPPKRKRLIVTFEAPDDKVVIVSGRDPDNHNELVFSAKLRTGQQDAFIKAVTSGVRGRRLTAASNQNIAPEQGTVVITGTGSGDGSGPKFWVELSL